MQPRWLFGMLVLLLLAVADVSAGRRLQQGLFEDAEYPDNGNRATRGHELAQQCADLTVELTNSKAEIESLLAKANEATYAAYKPLTIDMPAYENWIAEVKLTDAPLGELDQLRAPVLC